MTASAQTQLEVSSRLESLHLRRPQALARAIEQTISERDLQAGTRLGSKADMRTQFGVASTTVNEAIRVLQDRGVVQVKPGPGGGVFVAERSGWLALSQLVLRLKHSATAVAEVFAVRDLLELLIDTEAAEHHRGNDLADLSRLIDRMQASSHQPSAYLRSNWAFHRRTAELCTNTFARSLYEGLLDFAESELADVEGRGAFDASTNVAVHHELLGAITSRDPDRVAAAVKQHNIASAVVRQ